MAETHEPVDNMIRAASGDCHGANLKNLEQEVDIIKTSIMRLLMDIRERMNDLENPYTLAGSGSDGVVPDGAPDPDVDISDARKSALNAREAALDAKELEMDATKAKLDAETRNKSQKNQPEHGAPPVNGNKKVPDDRMFALPNSRIAAPHKPESLSYPYANETLRLQKIYHLFQWTQQSVRKFGHDRLEIMLESYRIMGYISKASVDEIQAISRLVPGNLGEENEVGPDEFVSVIYTLNRILTPNDISLDRDMIEVMTEHHQKEPEKRIVLSDFSLERDEKVVS